LSIIHLETGADLFATHAQAIVNPVNCVGVMGRGLALRFKHRFPANFEQYAAACKRGAIAPGDTLAVAPAAAGDPWIFNTATKNHWRDPSRLEWIKLAACSIEAEARRLGLARIACPALGAGLGGLPWPLVRGLLTHHFEHSPDIELLLHAPAPDTQPAHPWPRVGTRT
jgi:O-acetyl-ADP-ribose deacetylase (regulator of RNase III)